LHRFGRSATSLVGRLGFTQALAPPVPTKEVTVTHPTAPATRPQVGPLRDQLKQRQGLPFLEILSPPLVEAACRHCNHLWRERIYTPWITLGIFLSQVLSDDHSCDDAVDRFRNYRYDQGLPAVSPETTSYCDARQRLPEPLVRDLVRRAGRSIHQAATSSWLFHGRAVKIADGSTVVMPDTPENQAAYPQPKCQAPGVGFPILRLLVVFSLAVGTVLEAAVGPYQGKRTSELALLRMIVAEFRPGDIFLADRFFCSYWVIAALQARGVDVVVRLHQCRRADFRRGRRLGREDHRVTWSKPKRIPDWMSRAEYAAMPAELIVREFRVRVKDKTKRVRRLVVVTTLVDARAYPGPELGDLFRRRWEAELHLRSLKTVMEMEMLRTKSPEMVRKEVAMHLLAYNLIRGLMSEAARVGEVPPIKLSFTGALHTTRAFEESRLYDPAKIAADLPRLVELIGKKRVGDRPDRYEPRAVKRRPKPHPLLRMPREKARRLIKRGIIPYEKSKT
jgi:Transposase DDE domain